MKYEDVNKQSKDLQVMLKQWQTKASCGGIAQVVL